ncbi:N-acetylgalactosamine kinase [Mytilus galloprovincialis]|uniref:N-acetylgalactosamine kinase n=1 Tax=Mytilus galloprovincialis TaxID=29158 RepID=A0A8B6FKZ4_MYTGA|nr:N-acetylgalactosamine kinase [Mytilus galloprovincialis]
MENVPVGKVSVEINSRYGRIKDKFMGSYGKKPDYYARASGRVNLIGEHIDYCGYSVLPMAIEQDVVIAVSSNDSGRLQLVNTNMEYGMFECDINDLSINKEKPVWHNYFLCGLKGLLEHCKVTSPKGLQCVVDGTIPKSAGLSSSSALVCCAALVTMHANGQALSKKELSDMCAHCERFIGTEGGGMDQAISFMANKGTAKLIEFNPLKSTDVELPEDVVFVISNSCVELNKAATSHFNIRVVECRLASQIIAKTKGLKWREFKRFADVQKALGLTLDEAVNVVKEILHQEPYTKEEVCGILEVTADELAQTSLSANTLDVKTFKLHDRATHVFSEANRVLQFKKTCDLKPADASVVLGNLMKDSHTSCRDLYQCSCDDLDRLVDICCQSGALGSRLTGAGWGGCAVSMVPANQVDSFIKSVTEKYYGKDDRLKEKVTENLFATQPGGGAAIYLE